jgi:hypothetical protein
MLISYIGTLLGYSVHGLGMLVLYWGTQCMDWVCWYYTWVLSAWIRDIGTLLGYSVHGLGMLVHSGVRTQCMDSGRRYYTSYYGTYNQMLVLYYCTVLSSSAFF